MCGHVSSGKILLTKQLAQNVQKIKSCSCDIPNKCDQSRYQIPLPIDCRDYCKPTKHIIAIKKVLTNEFLQEGDYACPTYQLTLHTT